MSTLIQRLLLVIALCALAAQPHGARAQNADAPAHRDPKKVIDDALTRIFDGGSETPVGDARSLELTASEHAAANHAGRMFNTLEYAPGYGYADASIYDPAHAERARAFLAQLRTALDHHTTPATDNRELDAALVPFLRYLSVAADISNGKLTVPPKTKCRIKLLSYCMDKDWPAPRQGEKMQLLPVRTLLPGNFSTLYKSIISHGGAGPAFRAQTQGLVWTLRQIAQDPKGEKPVTISERQREILETSHPSGYVYFQMLRQPLGRSSLPEELERLVRQEVGEAIGAGSEQGDYSIRHIPDDRMADAVEQQLERLNSMPVTSPIPNNNSHYTKLSDGVYARTIYGSVEIQIANESDTEYSFDPSEYIAQSERNVQRMGPYFATIPEDVVAEILSIIADAPSSSIAVLSGYPRLSQLNPQNYRDASVATALDGGQQVKNLACLATVYTMIARGFLHIEDKFIDDYYPDPRLPQYGGETQGALQNDLAGRIGQQVILDTQLIADQLEEGRPTILRGVGGPLGQHFILVVGYVEPPTESRILIAHDPWPETGKPEGRVILLRDTEGGLRHPYLPLTFTHMRRVD